MVKYIRLGDLDYNSTADNSSYQDFNISQIFKHPNYTYPVNYNDIALLKLDKPAIFDEFVQPACLHVEKQFNSSSNAFVVAGWGNTDFVSDKNTFLRKAIVDVFPYDDCKERFSNDSKKLPRGIVEDLHICAGSEVHVNNTCQVFWFLYLFSFVLYYFA